MDPDLLERLRGSSGLSMDADGTLRHEGDRIENPRVEAMLRRGIGRAPDGRPIVRWGGTWAYLAAADDLWRVTSVAFEPAEGPPGRCHARLDDGSDETVVLGPGAVGLRADGALSLRVKDGTEWARCLPSPHAQLGAHLDEEAPSLLRTAAGPVPLTRLGTADDGGPIDPPRCGP
jgi:hypothetical protein